MILHNSKFLKHNMLLYLACISGVLFGYGWPPHKSFFLLFFSFVPIFFIEKNTIETKYPILLFLVYTYLSLVIWNVLATYWLFQTSVRAALLIYFIHPFTMLLPFVFYKLVKKRLGVKLGYISFICFYISYEYLIHHWEFAYPFLVIGNGLSVYPELAQWYEYTGVLGGTAWILGINIFIYLLIESKFEVKHSMICLGIIVVPSIISYAIYQLYPDNTGQSIKVAAVHTNIDAKTEKYKLSSDTLIARYFKTIKKNGGQEVDLIVLPESAIPNAGWMEDVSVNSQFKEIQRNIESMHTDLVTGLIISELEKNASDHSSPLVRETQDGHYYRTYTGAMLFRNLDGKLQFRSKQKMVPIEETLPYPKYFSFLREYIGSMGGFMFSSRGINNDIMTTSSGARFTYLICYESIFSDLTRSLVKKGADIILVGLNESWYKNLKAADQFMYYNALRAIENRRFVVRASNDGTTSFINAKGKIIKSFNQFVPNSLLSSAYVNSEVTLYTKFGNWFGIFNILLAIIIFFYFIVITIFSKKPTRS